jgi:hypothetical protein
MSRRRPRIETVSDIVEGTGSKGPKPRGWRIRFNERFVRRRGTECWEWTGEIMQTGYGSLSIANRPNLAHRLAFLLANGRIDPDLLVMHTCDNRWCVNPRHLVQGTHADNIGDAWRKGRLQKGETNGMAKLDDVAVLEIRKLREGGLPLRSIARRFGVWPACISRIVNRTRWKHL